jgi:hypothetical protein
MVDAVENANDRKTNYNFTSNKKAGISGFFYNPGIEQQKQP